MSCPNGTDDGHAASQPRHCTHASIARRERVVERRTVELHRAHRRDPARGATRSRAR